MRILRDRDVDSSAFCGFGCADASGGAPLSPPAATGGQSFDAPDRGGIVLEKPRRHQPRHQLRPPAVVREHFTKNRGRVLLTPQLPERGGLPEEDLVVARGQARSLG